MKRKIKILLLKFIGIFYKRFVPKPNFPLKRLFLFFFLQKIIGINRKVPWPVHFTSFVKGFENIKEGTKNPGFAPGAYIDGRNGIVFEENVWMGPKVSIISQNHSLTKYTDYLKVKPIKIGKNSLLLSACTILPGVELAEHTVVAAGSVVTKSFDESNILIGGIPAKIIKKINPYEE